MSDEVETIVITIMAHHSGYNNSSVNMDINGVNSTTYINDPADIWERDWSEEIQDYQLFRLSADHFKEITGDDLETVEIKRIEVKATCVTGDTPILCANHFIKNIEDLRVGDMIMAINPGTMILEEVPVTYIGKSISLKPVEIFNFDNGSQIKTLGNHRFWHIETNSMDYIQDFNIGDHTVDENGNLVALVSVDKILNSEGQSAYYLHNKYHNYFCDHLMAGDQATKTMNF